MPGGRGEKKTNLAEALVAYASRHGLGESVKFEDIEQAIWALQDDLHGASDLRAVVPSINDPDVKQTLGEWFARAAGRRDRDARDADRIAEKLLAPLQTMGLGAFSAAGITFAIGTLAPVYAVPILGVSIVTAGMATWGRWRLSKRSDDAREQAKALRRMAKRAGLPEPDDA